MYRKRILVLNDTKDAGVSYTPFLNNIGKVIDDPEEFRLTPRAFALVVFTGGSDVTPQYYGDTSPDELCFSNPDRDKQEENIFQIARSHNIPMFGICRGLQFLNVMAGGKLIHHLDGHCNKDHQVSVSDNETFTVNSLHHQMSVPPLDAEIIAWSTEKKSRRYHGDKDKEIKYLGPEVEGVYFPTIKAVGVQWHPEALVEGARGRGWAYHLARDIMNVTPTGMKNLYLSSRPIINYVS